MSELEAVRDALAATARVRERDHLVMVRALLDAARTVVPDVERASLEGATGVPAITTDRNGVLYVPLVAGDRAVAIAAFGRARAAWTADETLLLEIASAPVAYLLAPHDDEAPAAADDAANRGVTDELTGLYNAAFLDRRLPALVSQSETQGRPLAVVVIELDDVTTLSGSPGAAAADAAVRAFGAVLRSKVRGDDLAVHRRTDGFVLLLPETDAIGALRTVERLRAAVRAHATGEPLGFSAGIAAWRSGRDAVALLSAAAAQLADARGLGRGEVSAEAPA